MDFAKKALEQHKKIRGKISIRIKDKLDTQEKLSIYYTPGVAAVSSYVAEHPIESKDYTWLNNSVAIVSDGSAVLGLGNIGPIGALPVMEGKAMIFKQFADIDAVPIVLNAHTADEIVNAVKSIAPTFSGINLEDISAPICFEVEERLKNDLDIPVMHDDQHGTAVVVLAGLINAAKVTKLNLSKAKVVVVGAGAAGVAIAKLLYKYCGCRIVAVDSKGIIEPTRKDINDSKKVFLEMAPKNIKAGTLETAINNADVFIGVSKPNLLTEDMVKSMNKKAIVFAMANPIPEINPDLAKQAGAAIVATGRSDYKNQVNNALAFPGIFRGALDNNVSQITDEHKIAAAEAIAGIIARPTADNIIPSVFDKKLVKVVAQVFKS